MTARADLTDAQWARLEPLLPAPKRPGRPSRWPRRRLLDGIRWRIRVGCPWRDIPPDYGSWQAIYALFRRWSRAGVWAAILRQLQAIADAAGRIGWLNCHELETGFGVSSLGVRPVARVRTPIVGAGWLSRALQG
ncbi:transposase [Nocardia asiatica]|uniref:transposase n=1 Tax=Nocardia asiatica TaxID=209252 RepID=UPI003EE05367